MFRSNVPASGLPEGWRPAQLADIAMVHGGGRLKLNKSHYIDSGARAYSAAGPDGFVEQVEGTAPSVVLSSIGARCGKAFLTDGPWATLANTQVITPDPAIASANFLHGILDDETYWNRSGSAQPFIKPSDVKGAWVPLPPLDEQRRIAEVLRSVDVAIAAGQATSNQCRVTIRTLLEAAFSTGETVTLGDVCSLIYRYPGFYGFEQRAAGVPVIRGEHLRAGRVSTDWDDFYFVDPDFSARFPKTVLGLNDVVMSVRGTVGTAAVVDAAHVGSQISPNLIRLVADPQRVLPSLLFFAVQSAVSHIRKTIVNAQALPAINAGDLKMIEIALPPLDDQPAVLKRLESATHAAEEAARSLIQATQIKSKLLSDLLSGRVRVPA